MERKDLGALLKLHAHVANLQSLALAHPITYPFISTGPTQGAALHHFQLQALELVVQLDHLRHDERVAGAPGAAAAPSTAPTSGVFLALRVLAPVAALVALARRAPGALPAIAVALSPGTHAQLGPPGPRRRGALAWTTLAVALASLVVAVGVANGLVVPAQVGGVGNA